MRIWIPRQAYSIRQIRGMFNGYEKPLSIKKAIPKYNFCYVFFGRAFGFPAKPAESGKSGAWQKKKKT